MKIEITEGCVCYSYLIDSKEYINLSDSEHKDYNPDIIKKVFKLLLEDAEKMDNSIWDRLFCHFNYNTVEEVVTNYINNNLDMGNLLDLQGIFIDLVMFDPATTVTIDGPCGCCGDYIYTYTLELPEEG